MFSPSSYSLGGQLFPFAFWVFLSSTDNDASMTHCSPLGENNPGAACSLQWHWLAPSPLARDFAHTWKHKQCFNQSVLELNENPSTVPILLGEKLKKISFLAICWFQVCSCSNTAWVCSYFLKWRNVRWFVQSQQPAVKQRKEELLLVSPFSSQPPAPTPCTACSTTWPEGWTC